MIKKKVLPNTLKIQEKLAKMAKIYTVSCWAGYGVMEFPFAGCDKNGIPQVYQYYDANGTADEYHLISIYYVTSAGISTWTFSKDAAQHYADIMNEYLAKKNKKSKKLKE